MACKISNYSGGTRVSYIGPNQSSLTTINNTSTQIVTDISNISDCSMLALGGAYTPLVFHEINVNEATDDTILDKVQSLRTKWNAI
jgi:hypothetical protein